jgi:hypothetical protein
VAEPLLADPAADPPVVAAGLDGTLAALERQRQSAVRSYFRGLAQLTVSLALMLAPMLALAWLDRLSSDAGAAPHARMVLDNPVGPIALFCWLPLWLGIGIRSFRRHCRRPYWDYAAGFKAQVLDALCRRHFPSIGYEPGKGMSWKVLDGSGLFPFESDSYHSEDRFSGTWGSTDIAFVEAEAQRERRKLTGEGFEKVTETYFRGLVFVADFHKHFHSTTRLVPRGEKLKRARAERRAVMEDPEFEALFETWTTDQVDVRYVLSTSTMQRFCELNTHFPGLRARLHKEVLLLLLPSRRDRFEPSLWRRADCSGQLEGFLQELRACLAVVDTLALNTRIWSKA